MLNRILRALLVAIFLLPAGIHVASAGIIPNPEMSPTPTIPPIIEGFPTPSPTPTRPPIGPPPTPTLPPVSPTPVATPTIPPINPNALRKADAQVARAVVHYGQNGTLSLLNDRGRFQKVALQPGEVITVVLTLSAIDVGKPAAVELLDGGAMTNSLVSPDPTALIGGPPLVDTGQLLTVSQAGELLFGFQPGTDAGLHRISVIVGGNQYFLQFWRQDQSAPNNNPRMLRAY